MSDIIYNQRANKESARPKVSLMATTVKTIINRIKLFTDEEGNTVKVEIEDKIQGFVKNEDGEFTLVEDAQFFNMAASAFVANICNINDDIQCYRSCQEHSLNQKQLSLLFTKAEVTLNYEILPKGTKYVVAKGTAKEREKELDNDVVSVTIKDIKLSNKAQSLLDDYLTL